MLGNEHTFEALLDAIAERVAAKVRSELAHGSPAGTGGPRLMTVDRAAVYLGRTREAVQHLTSCGKIPTVRADRRIFLDVRDLDRWIEENKQSGD